MKKLETKRLILRDFLMNDLNDFFEYASIPGVGEDAGWRHHQNIETTQEILKNFIASKNEYAIVYKENNKVIGSLGVYNKLDISIYENSNQKEIGYVLSKNYWSRGLMTEALRKVLRYLFNDLNVYAIWCSHFDFNYRSKRVIEKCGFRYMREEITDVINLKTKYISYVYCLMKKHYDLMNLSDDDE